MASDYAADKANGGLGGFSGDGGPATSAELNDPQGVAVDGAGDLFIADTFNNAIREVTPAGIISTVVNAASAIAHPAAAARATATPDRLKLSAPTGRDRPEHRRPLHRGHQQQQDRRRHRPRPARRRGQARTAPAHS